LNYNNLDNDTQNRLLSMSKKDVESRFGLAIFDWTVRKEFIYL